MRIGFATIYSWRPHVEHLNFLADLVKNAGHHTEFLTCDGNLSTCYTRELRNIRPDWQECMLCRIGGIRSYTNTNISSIGQYKTTQAPSPKSTRQWSLSSASTLGRFESDEDFSSQEFLNIVDRLQPAVETAYQAAVSWIQDKKLEALCIFNGRMDATRAIFEAARTCDIPVVSLERTWFGDGLQLYPNENCLGLSANNSIVEAWADKPLTTQQATIAAQYIAGRFLQSNTTEWRAYNINPVKQAWPIAASKYKILLIPGSRNEIWGHPDWLSEWNHPIDAYDAIIQHFNLQPSDLVLRCHPNWGETIGSRDGRQCEKPYIDWAKSKGITTIPSSDKTSTLHLIEQCDAMVVASGSAALEAGALGKQVISVGASIYEKSGLRDDACNLAALQQLTLNCTLPSNEHSKKQKAIARQTLRFCYSATHRVPQYTEYVRALTPTRYLYKSGADANRFISILVNGKLEADDSRFAKNCNEETVILEKILNHDWQEFIKPAINTLDKGYYSAKRRVPFRPIDFIRNKMPIGDR